MFNLKQKNIHSKIMLIGLCFSVLYWLLYTIRDEFLSGSNNFIKYLLPEDSITIWIRLLGVFMIILLSGLIAIIVSKKENNTVQSYKKQEQDQYIKALREAIPGILNRNVKTNMLNMQKKVDKFVVDAEKSLSPGNIKKVLEIRKSFEKIIRPIEKLSDFSGIVSGYFRLSRSVFDMNHAVLQAVDSTRDLLEEKKLLIDTSFSDDEMLVYADFDKIKDVIIGMLEFYVYYSDSDSKLLMNVINTETDIVFTISGELNDFSNGSFNRIFINGQASLGEISKEEVLSTVIERAIVLSHKGRIWLSRNRNNYVSVSFSITREPIPLVMIIDDDLNTVLLIKEILERDNYHVIGKTDGEDALRILEHEKPNLIIVDLMMPDIDGYEFIEKINNQFDNKNIPIIIISGFHLDRGILMEVTGGQTIMPYIRKPIDIHELRKSVQETLSQTEKPEWKRLFIN